MHPRPARSVVDAWLTAWPGLTVEALDASLRALVTPARDLLAGRLATLEVRDVSPSAVRVGLYVTGLGPWMGWARGTGRLTTDDGTGRVLAAHLAAAQRRAELVRQELRPVLDQLAAQGVSMTVFKGAHTATYFPDAARSYVDVDLLVPPADIATATAVLEARGWHLENRAGAPDRWTWTPEPHGWIDPPAILDETVPWQLDLHATLNRLLPVVGRRGFGTPAPTGPVWSAHPGVRTLSAPLHFAYLAFHASAHEPELQLVRLVELVLMARAEHGDTFWEDVGRTLDAHDAWTLSYPAIALASQLAEDAWPTRFTNALHGHVPPALRDRLAARRLGDASALLAPPWERRLQWARTPTQRMWAVLELAWPRRGGAWLTPGEFLRSRWHLLRWAWDWWRRGRGRS